MIAFVHTMDVAPKGKIVSRRVAWDVSMDRWTYSQWIAKPLLSRDDTDGVGHF